MKRKIFGIALLVLIVVVFTGCKRRDPNNGKLVPEGTQIEFQIWTAQEKDFVAALVREFVTQSKTTGIVPKVIEFANDDELQTFLIEKMAEGTGPDVVFTEGNWIHKNQKKIIPLENDEAFNAAAFRNTFVRVANETLLDGEKILGVPLGVDTLGVFYNEEHLIDRLESRNAPAPTWDEFAKDAEKLTQEDNSFERFRFSGGAIGRLDNTRYGFDLLQNIMIQYGTRFFSSDNLVATFATTKGVSSTGKRINTGIEAIKFFLSFADSKSKYYSWNQFMADDDTPEKDLLPFVKGKTSITFGYSRDKKLIEELIARTPGSISQDWVKAALLPQREASGEKEIIAKTYGFAVPRGAENPDISWKFLQFASGKEIHNSFFQNTGMPSARLDLIAEQGQDLEQGIFARQAKFARGRVFPIDEEYLENEFVFLITNLNTGRYPIDKTVEKLEKKITEKVKAYYKREREVENNIKKIQQQQADLKAKE